MQPPSFKFTDNLYCFSYKMELCRSAVKPGLLNLQLHCMYFIFLKMNKFVAVLDELDIVYC